MTRERMNLKEVRALVVDGDRFGSALLVQMLQGLGCGWVHVCETGIAAQEQLRSAQYDICLCDSDLPDLAAAAFVSWLRRLPTNARFLPALMLVGYADLRKVTELRDAGAHLVVKKPVSAQGLYDRIAWMSKPSRAFVETPGYVGPDRRVRNIGPPGGVPRRATDLSTELGRDCGPNLSQDEIDSFVRPTRIFAE